MIHFQQEVGKIGLFKQKPFSVCKFLSICSRDKCFVAEFNLNLIEGPTGGHKSMTMRPHSLRKAVGKSVTDSGCPYVTQ